MPKRRMAQVMHQTGYFDYFRVYRIARKKRDALIKPMSD